MSSCRGVKRYKVVRARNRRMPVQLATGEDVSEFIFAGIMSPRHVQRALYLIILPKLSVLTVRTHCAKMALVCGGNVVSS